MADRGESNGVAANMVESNRPLLAVDRGYRRALRMAAAGGGIALIALSLSGNVVVGVMIVVGLFLGAWNSRRIFESAPRIAADGGLDRRSVTTSGARRLGYVTLVVVVLAIGLRPVGWTAVIGLAAFQFLLIANTAGPLLREVREG